MKTSELTGIALDWAVMKCECAIPAAFKSIPTLLNGTVRVFRKDAGCSEPVSPSTNWAHGGPIIERELIGIERCIHACEYHGWRALKDHPFDASIPEETTWGETPLVAAMRFYVASKLGDEVEIPEGLK
jgi:hypothetical protein